MVNTQNLVSDWSTRALNDKKCEFFRILQQFHFSYKFNVFSEWYTTDIFHVSDFTRAADPKWLSLTGQRNPLSEPAVINNENQTEWAFEEILNSWYSGPNCHFQYKVCWTDCNLDFIWYNADSNKFWNMSEVLHKYYTWYFNKSGLQFVELKLICYQLTRAGWKEIWNVVSEVVSGSLLFLY